MKIIIITPAFFPHIGGVEKVVFDEIDLLIKHNVDFFVITTDQGCKKKVYNDVPYSKKIIRLNSFNVVNQFIINPFSVFKILKKFESNNNLIHVHTFTSPLSLVAMFFCYVKNKNFIVSFYYHPANFHKFPFFVKILESISKLFIRKAKFIIAISEFEKEEIKKFNKNVFLLPLGLNYIPEYPYKERKDYFLFVGRLAHNKGIEHLIYLVNNMDIELKIVGIDVDGYSKKISKFKNIKYYENINQDKLNQFYKEAKVLILPSKFESFGLVVIEALSYGMPVIISNNVGCKFLLKNTPFENYIFNYFSKKDMLEKVKKFIKDSNDKNYYEYLCELSYLIAKNQLWQNIFPKFLEYIKKIF